MFKTIHCIAKCIGFAPTNFKRKKLNSLYIIWCIIVHQFRILFSIYCVAHRLYYENLSRMYGCLLIAFHLSHNLLISFSIVSTMRKKESWKKLLGCKLMNDDTVHHYYISLSILGAICYFVVLLIECEFFVKTFIKNNIQMYTWFSFHFSQCLNFFHLFYVHSVIRSIIIFYKKFCKKLQEEISIFTNDEINRKQLEYRKRYYILYNLTQEFHGTFSSSLLAVIITIFLSIVCAIKIFAVPVGVMSQGSQKLHLITFVLQVISALVSIKIVICYIW